MAAELLRVCCLSVAGVEYNRRCRSRFRSPWMVNSPRLTASSNAQSPGSNGCKALTEVPFHWVRRSMRSIEESSPSTGCGIGICSSLLYSTPATDKQQTRKRSAAISRKLRLLRAHGLIQKLPHTHRYQVTENGRLILNAILSERHAAVKQLIAKAA